MFNRRSTIQLRICVATAVAIALSLGSGPALAAQAGASPDVGVVESWRTLVEWAVSFLDGGREKSDETETSAGTSPPEGDEGPGMTPDG